MLRHQRERFDIEGEAVRCAGAIAADRAAQSPTRNESGLDDCRGLRGLGGGGK
jgi:hypothetical protein